MSERYLVISDLQIPAEHPEALKFAKAVQRDYRIPKNNVILIGDELDLYAGSRFPKDPDAEWTPRGEIKLSRERIAEWVSAFPLAKVCYSNHGLRWVGKAYESHIPSEILRPYREIYGIPRSWEYKDEWIFKTKHPFRAIHGVGYSGILGHRNAAIDGRVSTVIGHLHSHAGVNFIRNGPGLIWGMNVGSLIDEESFCFKYGKYSRFKSISSLGVILDDGKNPQVVCL